MAKALCVLVVCLGVHASFAFRGPQSSSSQLFPEAVGGGLRGVHKFPRFSVLATKQHSAAEKRDILIIAAPPAGGKGTQAKKISADMNIAHLSTGDMLRAEVAKGSDIGKEAEGIMKSGGLVSDDLVIKIVKSRISMDDCSDGFILDGFPRTVPQAEALDSMLADSGESVSKIISMTVPDDVVVQRITGRWIHKPSGRSYHVLWKRPKSLGDAEPIAENMLDDETGEPLTQRKDDTKEAAVQRLAKYRKETYPILEHYKAKGGDITTINGNQGIDEVAADIAAVLKPATTTTARVPRDKCDAAVPGSVYRESAWRRLSRKCKCPAGTHLTCEHAPQPMKNKFGLNELGCSCTA